MSTKNPFPPPPGHARRHFDAYAWRETSSFSDFLDNRINVPSHGIISVIADPWTGKTFALKQWLQRDSKSSGSRKIYVDLTSLSYLGRDVDIVAFTRRFLDIFVVALSDQLKPCDLQAPEIKSSNEIHGECQRFFASLNDWAQPGNLCIVLDQFHEIDPISQFTEGVGKAMFLSSGSAMNLLYVLVGRTSFPRELVNSEQCSIIDNKIDKYLFLNRKDIETYLARQELRWLIGSFEDIYRETQGHPALVSWIGFLAYEKYASSDVWVNFEEIRQDLIGYARQLWFEYREMLGLDRADEKYRREVEKIIKLLHRGSSWETVPNAQTVMKTLGDNGVVIQDQQNQFRFRIPILGDAIKD